jgi:hypothetical protein
MALALSITFRFDRQIFIRLPHFLVEADNFC